MSQKKFKYHENLIVRTPLLPLNNTMITAKQVFDISRTKFFKEAIYICSPVLYNELIKWQKGILVEDKDKNRLIMSLSKYYLRMQSRCTPYGLFAGCSIARWKNATEFRLRSKSFTRKTTLDNTFINSFISRLNQTPFIQSRLKFYVNDSIYISGNKLNYIEYAYLNNNRDYKISSIEYNNYIGQILLWAKDGITKNEVKRKLISELHLTAYEATVYVDDIINNQILISELQPSLIRNDPFKILNDLNNIHFNRRKISPFTSRLNQIKHKLTTLDSNLFNSISKYEDIFKDLKRINEEANENCSFNVDVNKTTEINTINSNIKEQIDDVITFLNRLTLKNFNPQLHEFKNKFKKVYGDKEIPLLEALDGESGIGYCVNRFSDIDPFIKEIPKQGRKIKEQPSSIFWDDYQSALHQCLTNAIKNNEYTVHFNDNDFKNIDNTSQNLPDSLSVIFRIINDQNIFIQSIGGISAANVLSRFSLNNNEIFRITSDIVKHEEILNKNKILAEISHIPSGNKVNNILLRPILREHKLTYLAEPDSSNSKASINLNDIMLSLEDSRLVLRSIRFNKQIIPRLTNAHNYYINSLPVYQFLCDVQHEYVEKSGFSFNWGVLSSNYKFLPRAKYRNVIIHPAKWRLDIDDIQSLLKYKGNALIEGISVLRKELGLPKFINIINEDQELLINLENSICCELLLNELKNKKSFYVSEFLFDPCDLPFKDDNENGYTNECIAILLKADNVSMGENTSYENRKLIQTKIFPVCSEWLSYRIYCGIGSSETILKRMVTPLVKFLKGSQLVSQFTYQRDLDPDNHLVLNFHILGDQLANVITFINKFIVKSNVENLIKKTQIEPCIQEFVDIAGDRLIFDDFHHLDSLIQLKILSSLDSDLREDLKVPLALKNLDAVLGIIFNTEDEKINFLLKIISSSLSNNQEKVQFDTKYRMYRSILLNVNYSPEYEYQLVNRIINWRDKIIKKSSWFKILEQYKCGKLHFSLDAIIINLIDSMIKRIFKANHDLYKSGLLNFLYRHYKSIAAKKVHQKQFATI